MKIRRTGLFISLIVFAFILLSEFTEAQHDGIYVSSNWEIEHTLSYKDINRNLHVRMIQFNNTLEDRDSTMSCNLLEISDPDYTAATSRASTITSAKRTESLGLAKYKMYVRPHISLDNVCVLVGIESYHPDYYDGADESQDQLQTFIAFSHGTGTYEWDTPCGTVDNPSQTCPQSIPVAVWGDIVADVKGESDETAKEQAEVSCQTKALTSGLGEISCSTTIVESGGSNACIAWASTRVEPYRPSVAQTSEDISPIVFGVHSSSDSAHYETLLEATRKCAEQVDDDGTCDYSRVRCNDYGHLGSSARGPTSIVHEANL